jgi:Ca2+-transporting ATPase
VGSGLVAIVLAMAEKPFACSADAVLKAYGVTADKGLTTAQAEEQRAKFGRNELRKEEGKSLFELIVAQFEDLLVKILLLAAVVSFVLAYFEEGDGDAQWSAFIEPVVILLILILNAFVGVWQESNAEAALDALKKLQPEKCTVLRDGHWVVDSDAGDLVPGDVIQVKVGDRVPADARVIQLLTTTLGIEQAQLTGESVSVTKEVEPVSADADITAKINMLFSSTAVCNGKANAVVTATGMSTEIGIIQEAVTKAAEEDVKTPLAQKIEEFGELLAKVIFGICAIVWIINYKHFFDPIHGSMFGGMIYYFKIAVALAVAAIPEGLPAVITTCLALGTRKMAARNCIVRQLQSVETLGCTTVICSDKTGTLTTNQMSCVEVALPRSKGLTVHSVEGHTYEPKGEVHDAASIRKMELLQSFARCCSLCNEARLVVSDGTVTREGEPTEAALLTLVEKLGCAGKQRNAADVMDICKHWSKNVTKVAVLEFSRTRKSMSVLVKEPEESGNTLFVKGAPESILERCTEVMLPNGNVTKMDKSTRDAINAQLADMASRALRVLGLAKTLELGDLRKYTGPEHKAHKMLKDTSNFEGIEQKLVFLGLVGILDPPRPEVRSSLSACRTAGIGVFMITGDNQVTAEAIAAKVGIVGTGDLKGQSFTGKEIEAMTEEQRQHAFKGLQGAVFSRTEPKHKQIVIKSMKLMGEVVAMTGDGVNDAPALKQADIGVAMGITGTEVAKEASDMVLVDDNFSTIVNAVEEGRSIYNNMKAFIRYLISSNIGEVASIFFTAALGIPEGLVPVQLLWVNLVTDGPPATALGFNPAEPDVMQKPPRSKDDALISGWVFFRYMVVGIYVGFATVGILVYWYCFDVSAPDGHTLVTLDQLMNWGKCSEWPDFKVNAPDWSGMKSGEPCSYFTTGKAKASSLSLTVLVVIEMLNALNALSEDTSLLVMPPWKNLYLILACVTSIGVHFAVLYQPFLTRVFSVTPLDLHDWMLVMAFSVPVIFIDEVLKFFGRQLNARRIARLVAQNKTD